MLRRVGTDRVTPGSQTSLREANRARIVNAVQQRGSLTQVELAGVTGLSPATVSNIVKELVASGVLQTSPTSRSGRRAQQVTLARNLGLVAGVHFGARSLRVALSDVTHRILAEERMPLPPEHRADAGLDRATLLVTELVESVDARLDEVLAVGVGVPAPVDPATGQVSSHGLLRGWDGVAVPEVLGGRLDVPVHVDNETNLGALAESRLGAGRGREHMLYVRVSHGVGGGLVLGGRLFRGRIGAAGEIGHVSVDEHGALCRCGNRGCLETVIGAIALMESVRQSHGPLTLRDIVTRALSGDPGCRRLVSDAGRSLGAALATVCNVVDPELVVVGGQLAQAGELLLEPVRSAIESRAILSVAGPVEVVAGELGPSAEVRGALALALDHVAVPGAGGPA